MARLEPLELKVFVDNCAAHKVGDLCCYLETL